MKTNDKKWTIHFFLRLFLVLTLVLFLGLGCSSSSSDDDDDGTTNTGGTTDTGGTDNTGTTSGNSDMEAALAATINVLAKGQTDQKVSQATNSLPGAKNIGDRSAELTYSMPCGTIETDGTNTVTMTFNGAAECDGLTGSISYSISGSGDSVSYTYHDIDTGDGCEINGTVIITYAQSGSYDEYTVTYDNLDICGETVDGTVSGSYDASTGIYSVSVEGEAVSVTDNGVTTTGTISTELEYDDGYVDGSTEVTIDGDTYSCSIDDVTIDPECGVPTSGTITISDGTESITVDFSSTSCSNQTVTYTYNGELVTYSLDVDVSIDD